MTLLLLAAHVGGGWDELVIAVVAIGVLWLAVKLAGRKPADQTEDDEESESTEDESEASRPPVAPPSA